MITATIKNTRIEGEQLVVFYEFSNGEINSNWFPLTATVADIKAWGDARAAWFDEREAEVAALRQYLIEQELVKAQEEIAAEES